MITLTVERKQLSWCNKITILKNSKGEVEAIIPNHSRQPRYGQKTIMLNCWKFVLDWSGVEKPVRCRNSANKLK